MSYTVKCKSTHGATLARSTNPWDENNSWAYGEVGTVDDAMIAPYNLSTDAFTVLGHDGPLTTGVAVVSGLSATDAMSGATHQTTFLLSDLAQAVVNGVEYQGTKLYTFPEGRILIMGVTGNLAQKTTSTIASTLHSGSVGALALGTVTASSTTLATTMADLLPSTAFASSTVINTAGTAVGGALATSAQFDGTTTPKELWLNTAYATTADVAANATQTVSGTITVTWANLGDY